MTEPVPVLPCAECYIMKHFSMENANCQISHIRDDFSMFGTVGTPISEVIQPFKMLQQRPHFTNYASLLE